METNTHKLQKKLRPFHLWAIAVGLVISGDYFGWNYGFKAGIGSFFIATLIVTIFYICFAFSFTELSTSIPQAGGPFAYSKRALGNLGGFLAGFATLVEFLFAAPAIATALGSYFHYLFPAFSPIYVAIAFFILFTIINLFGIQQTATFELIITVIASIGLVIYIFTIYPYSQTSILLNSISESNFVSIFSALPFAIWFYLAVEGVAMAAEETANPKRDIPIGYGLGIGTLVFFAITIMALSSGLGITEQLLENDHPLAHAVSILKGKDHFLAYALGYFGLVGIMASLLGIILGYSRQIYAISREGFLPSFLSHLNPKTDSPDYACIAGGFVGLLGILSGKTDELITLSVMGAIVMYLVSMISLLVLRKKEPELPRPFHAPLYPYVPILALILAIVCLVSVVIYNPFVSLFFFGFLLLNLIVFLVTVGKKNV